MMSMFHIGETVVHPEYGAGKIREIKELSSLGDEEKRYYSIQLIGDPDTTLMVPLEREAEVGLREPIPEAELRSVRRVLRAAPKKLPSNYKTRCTVLEEKLREGGVEQIAEIVRDLAARREMERRLTVRGKRFYQEGMRRLASEIAGAEGSDFATAESEIVEILQEATASAGD
jgi:RNA polymerase-interacting CarD/CdnL/TRCF family regulator